MIKKYKLPNKDKLPKHIAFIIDGNGRWAQKRGLPREMGHRAGMKALKNIVEKCYEFGVSMVSIYAFSTENWKRPKQEIDALFGMFDDYAENDLQELANKQVRIKLMGQMERLPKHVAKKLSDLIQKTKDYSKFVLNLGISYGGKQELLQAINAGIKNGVTEFDETVLQQYLYTADLPNPDFIVRTSGEVRLSNFMIWQGAYSELYFPKTYWPDFDEKQLLKALNVYAKRNRRFGAIKEKK